MLVHLIIKIVDEVELIIKVNDEVFVSSELILSLDCLAVHSIFVSAT